METVYIYMENGLFFEAKSFGAKGTASGEIVFNTSMSGYQEIITDPSYAGQFITFTAPEIGNVGANANDNESRGIFARAVIARNYQAVPSSYRSEEALGDFLKRNDILGICDIDTRILTKLIRKEGTMMAVASTELTDKAQLRAVLDKAPRMHQINFLSEVGVKKEFAHARAAWNHRANSFNKPSYKKRIVALDFGIKLNILNELTEAGLRVDVISHDTAAADIVKRFEAREIGGVFLSNGPGDPMVLQDTIAQIKQLLKHQIPMFGICLGHQLLSIAHGYNTYKLKFGHHGGNQPVKNLETNSVEITSQNHNYSVPETVREIAEVTHINLFDNTIEGIRYKDEPVFSVQFHPEASPGPHESRYLFKQFEAMVLPVK
ncbi:MAG: glutamine-hydrolyzing carbamoyl-phosphate synthase small subunit [Helicobacteraceae bacterium]|jgi:carbamoyl-phosphate synthase small subunit|nr:glutamine-hydrolyzing carbamoyl-phosphate synthase small subunit [Helicobacteraceae bacterium]